MGQRSKTSTHETFIVNLHASRQDPQAQYLLPAIVFKELYQAALKDEVHAPMTKSILQSFNSNILILQDWRDIYWSTLPSLPFEQWEDLFTDECQMKVGKNWLYNQQIVPS